MQNLMVPMIMLATFAMISVGVLLESTTLARAVIKNLLVVGGVVVLMLIAGALTM
jgi:hypothetical protein